MVDLRLYARVHDFLISLEIRGEPVSRGQAALDWVDALGLEADERSYVIDGAAFLTGEAEAGGWGERPPRDNLDVVVWTWHQAWNDRYGFWGSNSEAPTPHNS